MVVHINIPGKAQGKQRPKFSRQGNFVKTYTPEKTVNYENFVKMCWMQTEDAEKLHGNICAVIVARFSIPKSVSKKKRKELNENYCPKKPDCDNIAKSILDALNGIAYDDDAQIVSLDVSKLYSDTEEGVDLYLKEVTDGTNLPKL